MLGTAKLRDRKSISWPTTRNFERIHDRFQRDPVYRDSQLKTGWTEEKCIAMKEVAQEDHSCCPSSRRRDSASSSTKTIPIGERTWTDVKPGTYSKYSLSDYPVSKKLINLLRHGSLPREDDGAIEFWVYSQHWSDEKVEEKHGKRRRKQENISLVY